MVSALAVVGVVLLCLLAVYAATVGPREVLREHPTVRTAVAPSESSPTASGSAEPGESTGETEPHEPSPWWGVLLLLLALVAAGLLVVVSSFVLRWLVDAVRNRRAPDELDHAVDLDPLPVEELRERLRGSAQDQRTALVTGVPRNAIVRCWTVFEDEATALGWRREEWQTPAEFIVVVMDTLGVDTGALVELAGLYRAARFSSNPVTEEDRLLALAALDRVHSSLGAGARP